jgi:hypothetical protein
MSAAIECIKYGNAPTQAREKWFVVKRNGWMSGDYFCSMLQQRYFTGIPI